MPSPDELAALATEIGIDWEPMLWLGAVLGMRWGECAGLRVSRVDFGAGRISIIEQVTRAAHGLMVAGPPKSQAGRRTLGAPQMLLDVLANHIDRLGRRRNDLLFTEADGGYLDYSNWRHRVWVPACKRAGVAGLVFHDFRRVNATVLVAEGVDLKTAQTRLGHSDPRLTLAVYAQATSAADQDAADRVADRLMLGTKADTAACDENSAESNVR
jgi:integrase